MSIPNLVIESTNLTNVSTSELNITDNVLHLNGSPMTVSGLRIDNSDSSYQEFYYDSTNEKFTLSMSGVQKMSLDSDGNMTVPGTVNALSAAFSTSAVSGASTVNGTLTANMLEVQNGATFLNGISVAEAASFGGSLSVTGNTLMTGSVTATSTLSATGAVFLNGKTTAKNLEAAELKAGNATITNISVASNGTVKFNPANENILDTGAMISYVGDNTLALTDKNGTSNIKLKLSNIIYDSATIQTSRENTVESDILILNSDAYADIDASDATIAVRRGSMDKAVS